MKFSKSISLLLGLVAFSCSERSAKIDSFACKDFKHGKFEMIADNKKITVERTDSVQWERTSLGISKYKVTWKSECEYILELVETDIDNFKKIIGRKYEVKIVNTKANEYQYECSVEGIGFIDKNTLKKVE